MENRAKDWMVQYIASVPDNKPSTIDAEATFDVLGLDSDEAVVMAGLRDEECLKAIDPIKSYKDPSMACFAAQFAEKHGVETTA
ncbi:hypothetical protein [Falsiphaeobacter marinintestinus]|uniref:hypothetical protein n=1 Tax=Falsiphaeobacter marinintestinus TaxID=1492905 RepID=UPI0011B4D184|nr:hypothetical protein [Phaeobacter marinintestinus]